MKRLLVSRKPLRNQAWGGGNLFIEAVSDLAASHGYEPMFELKYRVDAILMVDPRPGDGIGLEHIVRYRSMDPRVKVIHRVNECDARKGTTDVDPLLMTSSKHVDATVFVSHWMREHHLKNPDFSCPTWHVVHNGVNRDHFHPFDGIRKSNGLVHIVAHHWSNNRMKGFDVYEALDRFVGENSGKFTFTYIGRELGTFKNTRVIAPLAGKELGRALQPYDVYVSGSLHDPGPNHILEAIATGLPTYVVAEGGGAVEFAGEDHTYASVEDLIRLLKEGNFKKNSFVPSTWEDCVARYFEVIETTRRRS